MLEHFCVFAKRIFTFGGFQVSQLPKNIYCSLLTAFQDMLSQEFVVVEPILNLIKAVPGKLIIDDTSNPKYGLKQWTRKLKILTNSGYQDGYKILLFLWECDWGRIPIGFSFWHKGTKPLNELTLVGLSLLRNRYGLRPEAVLADAAFCTDKLMKRLEGYGWACVMRFKSNRKIGNSRVDKIIARGYGSEQGPLKNGVKVKVFRRKKRFFVCNRMLWDMAKVVAVYTKRWKVEEVFRALKQCIGLKGCQQHSMKAQAMYVLICLVLFTCLELNSDQSVYQTAQAVISGERTVESILDERILRSF
jgi:hypothetical protein